MTKTLLEFRTFSEYPDCLGVTSEECEGVTGLYWVQGDVRCWEGILRDWRKESTDFMECVKKFDVVVSAGGNCGMYPRFYGNYFKTVYSFEPCPYNFECLQMNCVGDKYKLYQGALSTVSSTNMYSLDRFGGPDHNGAISIKKDDNGCVDTYCVDDLNLDACDLIHLDVEGHEFKSLQGAVETIKKFNPVIILERIINPKIYLKSIRMLGELGYKNHKTLLMDAILIPNGV